MQLLYNLLVYTVELFIPVVALFSTKMRLFYSGRKETYSKISEVVKEFDNIIWMHCASLGEFEQGKPVLEGLKQQYANHKIVITFFSPSGYEIRKNEPLADLVLYLPLDTPNNNRHFLKLLHPDLAIFVKYEFWPNLLLELKRKEVKTILVSGIFRENQVFFNKRMNWIRKPLNAFSYFFVQDQKGIDLLKSIGFDNATLSGDTRFDRVYDLVNHRKELEIIAEFSKNSHVLVAGSTWDKDENILLNYINTKASKKEKFIIAPHNIKTTSIDELIQNLKTNTLRYSEANLQNAQGAKVLIIDSIGLLTSVYAYASIAYVGGGFGTGIHNVLEPATYGIPILIGPKYQKFNEANELIFNKACFVVHNKKELTQRLHYFSSNPNVLSQAGAISRTYIEHNIGATAKILDYISKILVP